MDQDEGPGPEVRGAAVRSRPVLSRRTPCTRAPNPAVHRAPCGLPRVPRGIFRCAGLSVVRRAWTASTPHAGLASVDPASGESPTSAVSSSSPLSPRCTSPLENRLLTCSWATSVAAPTTTPPAVEAASPAKPTTWSTAPARPPLPSGQNSARSLSHPSLPSSTRLAVPKSADDRSRDPKSTGAAPPRMSTHISTDISVVRGVRRASSMSPGHGLQFALGARGKRRRVRRAVPARPRLRRAAPLLPRRPGSTQGGRGSGPRHLRRTCPMPPRRAGPCTARGAC